MAELSALCLGVHHTLSDAFRCLEKTGEGIVLVVDDDRRLTATITDGDLRRAVLAGLRLELSIGEWLRRMSPRRPAPISAHADTPSAELLQVMRAASVRHIPVTDDAGTVVSLATMRDLITEPEALHPAVRAVIMAGGRGQRLLPLTLDVPKPMLRVGDKPILEHLVHQLRDAGICQLNIATHYLPQQIVEHFQDGASFGVAIDYVQEDSPLGTAGALGLLPPPGGPLLVMNSDIVTRVDFRAMTRFHADHAAALTVAVRQYDFQVPYGVLDVEGAEVRGIVEKPTHSFFVNAGIYLLEPRAHKHIPRAEHCDMPDLMNRLLAAGETIAAFPVLEYWLDVGRPDDYQRAQDDALQMSALP